ncbi:MAG: succinate--CoA ligase subunit alpha [Halodesulfurarchaeum sp.]
MSILVDADTRVVVQGITGSQGEFHAEQMLEYGTNVVAGAVPGRGGQTVGGVPVYDRVEAAVEQEGADASVVFVPPAYAADALFEALDAELDLVVAITEGIPVHDAVRVYRRVEEVKTRLIGPNCPGVITPGVAKLGILPGEVFQPGSVGVVSRSGTLTYQIVENLTNEGLGQSTAVGIGGDPIVGTGFQEVLAAFERDPGTDSVVLIGEIGGEEEEQAAAYIEREMDTPVVGFIAGRTAPPGTRMGHAGAIVSGSGTGTAESKIRALEAAGVPVGKTPGDVASLLGDLE